MVIAAEDQFNNEDTSYSGNVNLALAANPPGNATLGGVTSEAVVNGEASFSGFNISTAGVGYTVKATSGNFSVTTKPFNIAAAGIATQLVVTTQPADSQTAGVAFPVVVAAEDGFGTIDTSYAGSVTLALETSFSEPGASTPITGSLTATFVHGVATFSNLAVTAVGANDDLTAASAGLAGTTSDAFSVVAASAVKLVVGEPITSNTLDNVLTGDPFQVNVFAEDPFGNIDQTFNGTTTIALGNNQGALLGGTLSVSIVDGTGELTGLTINQPGTGYTIKAMTTGLANGISSLFDVTNDQLVVTTSPPGTVETAVGFGFVVKAENAAGVVDTSFTGSVTANSPDPNGVLGGPLTVQAVAGVAIFKSLTFTQVPLPTGLDINLTAAGAGSAFTFVQVSVPAAGPATHLAVLDQPETNVLVGADQFVVVAAEDANGIVNTSAVGNATIALAANPGHAALGGTLTEPLVNGEADFFDLTLNNIANGYTLKATNSSLGSATTQAFNVVATQAGQLAPLTSPQTLANSAPSSVITFQLQDAAGHVSPAPGGGVLFTLSSNSAGSAFFDANGNPLANATITVPAGATTVSFEYSDTDAGTPIITVSAPGFTAATQQETITNAPGFANVNHATFFVGKQYTFTFTTGGAPAATLSLGVGVPSGVNFTPNDNGTATLSGDPGLTTGVYVFNVAATNGVMPDALQVFTLTVINPPTFTSGAGASFVVGVNGPAYTVQTTPGAAVKTTLSISPKLPAGLTFTNKGNGSAVITGTPAAGTASVNTYTITAATPAGSATQSFQLIINQKPAFTSAASTAIGRPPASSP